MQIGRKSEDLSAYTLKRQKMQANNIEETHLAASNQAENN
jgi:hypothetical protein